MSEFEELKKKLWDSIDKSSKQLAATQRVLLAVLNVEANTKSPFEFIPDLCELDKCRCGDGWVAGCLCEHHNPKCNGGCTFSFPQSHYDPDCPEHGHLSKPECEQHIVNSTYLLWEVGSIRNCSVCGQRVALLWTPLDVK